MAQQQSKLVIELSRLLIFLSSPNLKIAVICLALILSQRQASAKENAELQHSLTPGGLMGKNSLGLFFPLSENGGKILPLRFEYTLVEGKLLKVGDILMDTSQIQFQVIKENNGSQKNLSVAQLRFQWPAGLFKDAEVSLRNNNGKIIWSSQVKEADTKILAGKAPEEFQDSRNNFAEWLSPNIDPELLEDMKFLSFMTFCVESKDGNSWISICSPELYYTSEGTQAVVKVRKSNRLESVIEINGKRVSDQGVIFLNDPKENVSLRAITKSGANVEIETRMRAIEFLDATQDTDPNRISVLMYGTNPIDEKQAKKLGANFWKLSLDASRPFLYVQGQSGIPMRQEFYFGKKAPLESQRILTRKSAPTRTYRSSVELKLRAPSQSQIEVLNNSRKGPNSSDDQNEGESIVTQAQLIKSDKDNYFLNLSELRKGQINSSYLRSSLKTGEVNIATTRIYRAYDSFASIETSLSSTGQSLAQVHYETWFEEFLWLSPLYQNMGASLDYGSSLSTAKDFPKFNFTKTSLRWRTSPGIFQLDNSWGVYLPLWFFDFDSIKSSSTGLGLFYDTHHLHRWMNFFDWHSLSFDIGLSHSGDIKPDLLSQASWQAHKRINNQWQWSTKLGVSALQLPGSNQNLGLDIGLGMGLRF